MTPLMKEQHLAFMPTSNDALHSPMQPSNGHYTPGDMSSAPHHPQDNGTITSPWQTSRGKRSNSQILRPARKLSVTTNSRQPQSATSLLPDSATDGPEPTEGTFWYHLHLETLENFERERITWRKMTERLRCDIDRLTAELDEVRAAARHDSAFYSAYGKENDKIFFSQSTTDRANEKLREFSVISPRGTSPSPEPIPSPASVAHPPRKASSAMRLPSISEDVNMPPRRVSIAEPIVTDIIPADETSDFLTRDDPLSPPATAQAISPLPESYIADAGHTPRRGSVSNGAIASKPLRLRHNSIVPNRMGGRNTTDGSNIMIEDIDEDPELDSPRILPTTPSKGSSIMLTALNERLEQVADHPDENEPEVVKAAAASLMNANAEPSVDNDEPELPEKGIKLRTRPSLNFGSQLGQLK